MCFCNITEEIQLLFDDSLQKYGKHTKYASSLNHINKLHWQIQKTVNQEIIILTVATII